MSSPQYWCCSVLLHFGYICSSLGKVNNIMAGRDIIGHIDNLLMEHICGDIINGTLLVQEDDATLQMLLEEMYDDMSYYEGRGVICGKA